MIMITIFIIILLVKIEISLSLARLLAGLDLQERRHNLFLAKLNAIQPVKCLVKINKI